MKVISETRHAQQICYLHFYSRNSVLISHSFALSHP